MREYYSESTDRGIRIVISDREQRVSEDAADEVMAIGLVAGFILLLILI